MPHDVFLASSLLEAASEAKWRKRNRLNRHSQKKIEAAKAQLTLHYRVVLLFLGQNHASDLTAAHQNLPKTIFKYERIPNINGIFLKYLLLKLPFLGIFLQLML